MNRVLYILKHNPWGIGGGCYASLMYLTAFRQLFPKHQFDVCICQECMNDQPTVWEGKCNFISVSPRRRLNRLSSIFTGIMHRYQSIVLKLIEENEYDYCIFDHNNIAGTLCSYLKPNTKSIVIHHNYEPQYFRDNTTSKIHKLLFMHHVKSTERNAYLKCSYNIFLTQEDEYLFRKIYGNPFGKATCIGIFDIQEYTSIHLITHTQKNVIVITGSLNNIQNTDGIVYFMRELYPLIANRCEIIIAGKNPSQVVQNIVSGYKNIQLVPNSPNINDIISLGNIFICPTRLGGGIKIRISDGLRNGIPVIAHAVSARGYGDFVSKGYFYVYSTPSEFLSQFNKLEKDRMNKKFTSEEIVSFYHTNNSLAGGIDKLKRFLEL